MIEVPRWHNVEVSPDAFAVQEGDKVVGSLHHHGDRWHVEVLMGGRSGDIRGEFHSHEQALAFIEGIEKTFRAMRGLAT